MRTTVIPAQITTVEDKIAGSLNFTQILLLMVPVFWITFVYAIFPPKLHLMWYKIPLALIVLLVCLVLAVRIKEKIVLHWLLVILRYSLRPKYYLFNKNDSFSRDMDLPIEKKARKYKVEAVKKQKENTNFGIAELVYLENLVKEKNYSLSFKNTKKGGLNVVFEKIQK